MSSQMGFVDRLAISPSGIQLVLIGLFCLDAIDSDV